MSNKTLSIRSRIQSFGHATKGMSRVLKEPNMKLHLIATIVIVGISIITGLSLYKWIALCFAIGLVWITEIINTAIEVLCDYACKEQQHPLIKDVKDIAAGAVLFASALSCIIGILIFIL